ncbi:hypothetical protein HOY82DRAFT_254439 [Tuber indicum]|nr:hypothetical protein HOY82DRAFT_254439 [Tuber indicum]
MWPFLLIVAGERDEEGCQEVRAHSPKALVDYWYLTFEPPRSDALRYWVPGIYWNGQSGAPVHINLPACSQECLNYLSMLPAVPSILHCKLQCCPGWLLLSPNPANINNPSRPVARRIASMMGSTSNPSRAQTLPSLGNH